MKCFVAVCLTCCVGLYRKSFAVTYLCLKTHFIAISFEIWRVKWTSYEKDTSIRALNWTKYCNLQITKSVSKFEHFEVEWVLYVPPSLTFTSFHIFKKKYIYIYIQMYKHVFLLIKLITLASLGFINKSVFVTENHAFVWGRNWIFHYHLSGSQASKHESPNFLRQRATLFIMSRFGGSTWKNNISGVRNCINCVVLIVCTQFIFSGYWVIPGGKETGAWRWLPTPI